eukprot:6490581-Prymnesium_polylepis.1
MREGGLRVTTAAGAAPLAGDSGRGRGGERHGEREEPEARGTRVGDYYADLLAEAADRGVHALEAAVYAIAAHGNAAA